MKRRQATASRLAATLCASLLVSCASAPPSDPQSFATWDALSTPLPTPLTVEHLISPNQVANATQALLLLGKISIIEPLIRPFSTEKALVSLVLKSTFGFAQRFTINTFRFQALEKKPIPALVPRPSMDLIEWEAHLAKVAGTSTTGTVKFLLDGDEFFPRMLELIGEAEKSIDIRTYIFDNDHYGVKIADALKERSEDLDVKVLLDGIGTIFGTQVNLEEISGDFRSPIAISSHLQSDSHVKVRTSGNPFLTGDHTKTTIIDGRRAFLGGMNIGREYRYEWHDLMMEVTGPVVDLLQRDYDIAWSKAGWLGDLSMLARILTPAKRLADEGGVPITILTTRDHDSQLYRAQLAAIRRSQSYIYIENPYFSDDITLFELAKARRRGVDVRVILPEDGNHQVQNFSNELAINTMLRNGIRVYIYPGMSHVKAAIYDGWACFGSANFDKLSLQINEELNLGTSDPNIVGELLARVFIPDFETSEQITTPIPTSRIHHLAEFFSDELL